MITSLVCFSIHGKRLVSFKYSWAGPVSGFLLSKIRKSSLSTHALALKGKKKKTSGFKAFIKTIISASYISIGKNEKMYKSSVDQVALPLCSLCLFFKASIILESQC